MEMNNQRAADILRNANLGGVLRQAADYAVERLTQTEWISVKERLPEQFVSVLVYMPEERPLPTVHEGYVTPKGRWYAHFFEREPLEVTHWMPLPEPPKEGADHE